MKLLIINAAVNLVVIQNVIKYDRFIVRVYGLDHISTRLNSTPHNITGLLEREGGGSVCVRERESRFIQAVRSPVRGLADHAPRPGETNGRPACRHGREVDVQRGAIRIQPHEIRTGSVCNAARRYPVE